MAETKITIYDVGHGSCAHIITPNNKHILVDLGGGDDFSPADHLKNFLRIPQLDALVITHPHEDHYHDISNLEKHGIKPKVLSRTKNAFPVEKTDKNRKDHERIDAMNGMSASYTHPVDDVDNPFLAQNNGGVEYMRFLPDDSDIPESAKDDPNRFSGLYALQFGGVKVILTGDNNKEILENMIKRESVKNAISNADFLLAPHHGRTSDYCDAFFKLVNPKAVMISDKKIEHETQENSSEVYNNGRGIDYENEKRFVFTTRKDGNIELKINSFGSYSFNCWHHKPDGKQNLLGGLAGLGLGRQGVPFGGTNNPMLGF